MLVPCSIANKFDPLEEMPQSVTPPYYPPPFGSSRYMCRVAGCTFTSIEVALCFTSLPVDMYMSAGASIRRNHTLIGSDPQSRLRPVSILRISKHKFADSNFPADSIRAWELHPLRSRFRSSQTLSRPESRPKKSRGSGGITCLTLLV